MNINIVHQVQLFAQPTNMTCWSAAATMLFGNRSVGAGGARTGAGGGLTFTADNMQTFASSQGLRLHYPQSWSVEGLASIMASGPIMVCGAFPSSHAVVISSLVGDGTPEGTKITIYDPWPPTVGTIVRNVPYSTFMQKFPQATTYILHR